jgi:putative endonuclease
MKIYYVYIVSSDRGTLYVGVTNNIVRRVYEHKQGEGTGFTSRYKVHRLVYFEEHLEIMHAINREKEIKKWRRSKKVKLVKSVNPKWDDLSDGWYDR